MKCTVCDGFGGWYDGMGPNAEPVKCDVCDGTGEVNQTEARTKIAKARYERVVDESAVYGISCPSGKCDY